MWKSHLRWNSRSKRQVTSSLRAPSSLKTMGCRGSVCQMQMTGLEGGFQVSGELPPKSHRRHRAVRCVRVTAPHTTPAIAACRLRAPTDPDCSAFPSEKQDEAGGDPTAWGGS